MQNEKAKEPIRDQVRLGVKYTINTHEGTIARNQARDRAEENPRLRRQQIRDKEEKKRSYNLAKQLQ
eukprot:1828513-Heterocapsa_arctica.AAC.1